MTKFKYVLATVPIYDTDRKDANNNPVFDFDGYYKEFDFFSSLEYAKDGVEKMLKNEACHLSEPERPYRYAIMEVLEEVDVVD